jgi:ABC transporter with metal-binding/Fe-S-binding domain ATP-binding protein
MFHFPAVNWTGLQAEAAGIPQMRIPTSGVKERELEDLRAGLDVLVKSKGIEGIVSGAIASEYQRTRLDNLCEDLGLRSFAPLWHKPQQQLVEDEIEAGVQAIVTSCSALGLDEKWLGRRLGKDELKELVKLNKKYGLSVAFEGGEAETFTLACPAFQKQLLVLKSKRHWSGSSGYLELEDVKLA